MSELDQHTILSHWSRFARLVALTQVDERAVVLIDSNGDQREIELEYWVRNADGQWEEAFSLGSDVGQQGSFAPLEDLAVAWGRAPGLAAVIVKHEGREHQVRAGEGGWWLAMIESAQWGDGPVRVR